MIVHYYYCCFIITHAQSIYDKEHNGYLRLAAEEHAIAKLAHPNLPIEARAVFKFGAQGDGYWNNDHFIAQVEMQ